MAINNKYNIKQQKIKTEIWRLKRYKKIAYDRWHELDMKINVLEANVIKASNFNKIEKKEGELNATKKRE